MASSLEEGAKSATLQHVLTAIAEVDAHGVDWLFQQTGRTRPRYRYSEWDGALYPTKALGHRVAQLAAGSASKENVLTTNIANAPLLRAGLRNAVTPKSHLSKLSQRQIDRYALSLTRPEQAAFRLRGLSLWSGRCALSGCDIPEALEAAHIRPVSQRGSDLASNSILLRADLHRLFDLNMIAVNPSNCRVAALEVVRSQFRFLNNLTLMIPENGPSSDAFEDRWHTYLENTR